MAKKRSRFLQGRRIDPPPITGAETVANLVDNSFLAYNAARLREACLLFTQKMLEPDVTVGLSLTGALTPGEAVSWGKVDPDRLPDAVVCYIDSTVALTVITAYALARHEPREPKRLYERRGEFMELLESEYHSRSDVRRSSSGSAGLHRTRTVRSPAALHGLYLLRDGGRRCAAGKFPRLHQSGASHRHTELA